MTGRITKTNLSKELAIALEETEAAYWSKYYYSDKNLPSFARTIAGAFVGSVPELDILAMNRVIGLGVRNIVKSDDLESIIRFYQTAGAKRFFIQLSDYTIQDDLPSLLSKAGFRLHNHWAKLAKKIDDQPFLNTTELDIVKVTGQNRKKEIYGQILFDSFDWKDPRLRDWLCKPIGDAKYHNYLAYHDETPIAAAALHVMGRYASLALAGTLPSFRGMGAQGILIEYRLKQAFGAGCEYVFSETGISTPEKPVQSHLNMLKAGFEEVYQRENWILEL